MTSRNTTIQDILSVLMNDIYPENKSSNVPFNLNSLFAHTKRLKAYRKTFLENSQKICG